MDLWRRWIRRMHSVWQVVREEGLSLHRTSMLRWRSLRLSLTVVALVAVGTGVVFALKSLVRHEPAPKGSATASAATAMASFNLAVVPDGATVFIGDRPVGTGGFHDRLEADMPHRVRLTAPGYAETTLAIRLSPGSSESREVRMRPYLGGVRVETVPPGALVSIDGKPAGRSPLTVDGLPVAVPHRVEASLEGRGQGRQDVMLEAGHTRTLSLSLAHVQASVVVTSEPPGALILLDGLPRGSTPFTLTALPTGVHRLEARREDHAPGDTTLEITTATAQVHLVLRPAPPGVLVIQGDRPAQIYVDDALVVENVQNSGPRTLRAGPHQVRVVMVSGEVVEQAVTVRSAERVIFDYSRNSIERRPGGAR